MSRYHFAHHFAPHNLTVSARDRGNGMWKWVWSIEVQWRRLHTFSSATEAGDTQRQGGRAMLKDILPCPFGLGLEIDIFQSDEALMWVIQLFHHCDMRLLANAHPCWWAHPTPQGLWLAYPPSSFPSLSASLCHLCSFISIALLPCFLSPCHVQSLFGWPGTQSGRQGAPGRELPNTRQDGHWNDSNNGVPVWPRLASQLAGLGWGLISVWCLQGKEVWRSTANPGHSSQAGAARQELRGSTVEQDVRSVLICVALEVATLFV